MNSMKNLKLKCQKPLFCKSSLLMGPCYDVTISMIYKMRMGDPIEIKLVPMGFLFQRAFKSNMVKNDVSSTIMGSKIKIVSNQFT